MKKTWTSLGFLSAAQDEHTKAFLFLLLLSPLSLSSFFFSFLSLVSHDPRGYSYKNPLILVNKRGKRWHKFATFPLEPTWAPFIFVCLPTSGRPNLNKRAPERPKMMILNLGHSGGQKQNIYILYIFFSFLFSFIKTLKVLIIIIIIIYIKLLLLT